MFSKGDQVRFKKYPDQGVWTVCAVDPNFEGAGQGIAIKIDGIVEWFNADLVEKDTSINIPPGLGVSSALKPKM